MDLKQFVSQVLADVVQGVADAQANLGEQARFVNPQLSTGQGALHQQKFQVSINGELVQQVEFDVAVTAKDGTGTKGGIGVVTGIFAMGSQGQSTSENSHVSRIKFSVPVTLPYGVDMATAMAKAP